MKMKKIILLLTLMSTSLFAQENRHEKIEALKRAHITEALDLSSSEAEKFWPVYNSHEKKRMMLRKTERNEIFARLKERGLETLSEKEANSLIDKSLDIEAQEHTNHRDFILELKKVLAAKKILKLKKAEEDFKRRLLKQIRQRNRKD